MGGLISRRVIFNWYTDGLALAVGINVLSVKVEAAARRRCPGIPWKSARSWRSATNENTGCGLRDSQAAGRHRDRPQSGEPRGCAVRSRPPAVSVRLQFVRPFDGHPRDRACGGRDWRHGRVSPFGTARGDGADRDAALHGLQLVLRSDPSQPSEQLLLPLLWRGSRRLRILHQGQVSRDFGASEATLILEMVGIRVSGQSLSALPAVLGALSMFRSAGQGDEL